MFPKVNKGERLTTLTCRTKRKKLKQNIAIDGIQGIIGHNFKEL